MAESFNGIVIEDDQTIDQALELQNLQVAGNCYFMDTVEADRIEVDGTSQFRGFVTCDRLMVTGTAMMMQRLLTETMQVTGSVSVLGRCWSDVAVFEGQGLFHGPFSTGRLLIKAPAVVDVTAKLKADRITVNGKLLLTTKLKCKQVEFISCMFSTVHEISADRLEVCYKARADQPSIASGEYVLVCSFVDAEEVCLEYAHVEQLFCDSAIIGRGCHIRELVYRDKVEIDSGAVVERLSKA